MKIYKFSSLTTFIFTVVIIGLIVFLPIALIETLWNTTIGKTYTDLTISFWQALILWLIILTILNILGIFKFEFAIETGSVLDKETLKKKLETLQSKLEDTNSQDKEIKKETNDK